MEFPHGVPPHGVPLHGVPPSGGTFKASSIDDFVAELFRLKAELHALYLIFNGSLTTSGLPDFMATRKTVCGKGSS